MKKIAFLLIALIGACSASAQTCEPNMDFELGTTANWQMFPSTPTHYMITSGTGTDACGGFPIVGAGIYSLKIGDATAATGTQRATRYVHVPTAGSYNLIYRWAGVVQYVPGIGVASEPRIEMKVYDSASNVLLYCSDFTYIPSASGIPGWAPGSCPNTYYSPWKTYTLDLNRYHGSTMRVELKVADATGGTGYAYLYFDMTCGSSFISMVNICAASTVILTAPSGFATYAWYDSSTFTTLYATTAIAAVPKPLSPAHYAVIMTPAPGLGCPDTLYMTVPPDCSGIPLPGTISASATLACATSTFTLTNTGYTGTDFQWQSSPDSLTWSNIAGATNTTYAATGITANTFYRCKDSCCASGLTAVSAGLKITYAPCCSGTPITGTTTVSTTYCSACSLTLDLTGYTPLLGLNLQWQASPDSVTWADISGGASLPYSSPISKYLSCQMEMSLLSAYVRARM